MVYDTFLNTVKEQMEQAYGQMGELVLVRDRIDEVIER